MKESGIMVGELGIIESGMDWLDAPLGGVPRGKLLVVAWKGGDGELNRTIGH
jgi:hypothetical protein